MRKQTAELMQGESREAFLRRTIDDAGLTLKDFAVIAGIPVTSLGTILKRGIGTTSIDTILKICDALEIDFESFARGKYYSGTSDTDINIINTSELLRKARYALRYRAAVLAEMLDISLEQYYRFESSHYVIPPRYLRMLSKIMNIPYEYFLGKDSHDFTWESSSIESPEEFEDYDLGLAIKTFRNSCNLTQHELGAQLGISDARIMLWETRTCVPTATDLAKMCTIFSTNGTEVTLFSFKDYLAKPEPFYLSDEERALILKYRNSSDKERRLVEMALEIE